jgi:hypothetical protein
VIKYFSDLRFSPDPPFSSINKTDRHDIHVNKILLKVVLNTIKQAKAKKVYLLWYVKQIIHIDLLERDAK